MSNVASGRLVFHHGVGAFRLHSQCDPKRHVADEGEGTLLHLTHRVKRFGIAGKNIGANRMTFEQRQRRAVRADEIERASIDVLTQYVRRHRCNGAVRRH